MTREHIALCKHSQPRRFPNKHEQAKLKTKYVLCGVKTNVFLTANGLNPEVKCYVSVV